jgi:hypothetical protein
MVKALAAYGALCPTMAVVILPVHEMQGAADFGVEVLNHKIHKLAVGALYLA